MSKPYLKLGLAAFAVRAAAAILNRIHPVFPSYYFNDATIYDAGAWQLANNWHVIPQGNPTYLANEYLIAAIYSVFGHHPMIAQLFNCLLGAFCAVALARIGMLLYPSRPKAGMLTGILFAFWPSCIFYNSQILKDNVVLACIFGALWTLCSVESNMGKGSSEMFGPIVAALLILLTGSFFRWYSMLFIAASFVLSELFHQIRTGNVRWLQALSLLGFFAVLFGLKIALHHQFFGHPIAPEYMNSPTGIAASPVDVTIHRLDPKALSDLRKNLEHNVGTLDHRPVQTLIEPNLEFRSWWDVARFLPKGIFYVGFMPLPGFYPLGHNLGRWLAAFENLALLGLAALGIWGAYKLRKNPSHGMILLFIVMTAVVSGLLEPDLGAASRHKLQYFPCLFLFAAPFLENRISRLFSSP